MKTRLCRPEEEEASWKIEADVWNPFNWEAEGATSTDYFSQLHFLALDGEEIVGTIDGCPFAWSGDPRDLPEKGWSEMVDTSDVYHTKDHSPEEMYVGAIGASVKYEGRGAARELLVALKDQALGLGYRGLIAPVRPVFRARVPEISLEDYAQFRLESGKHFDPWVRVHESIGGKIIGVCHNSAHFEGRRESWERWSGMRLPSGGRVLFPGAIDYLEIKNDWGTLIEPSLWLLHE